ncbi:MAG: hypothetical protein ACI9CU_002682 [Polaribacter sp.]|jgi:hypothetical protein
MRRRNKLSSLLLALIFLVPFSGWAQADLMQMLEDSEPEKQEKVTSMFKTTRVIQAHSIETVKKKTMDVRISHRFGNIYSTRNEVDGPDSFFGFDNIADVRLAVEYGITDELMIGLGRSQMSNLVDGFVKWRFYQQTTDNKRPFSLAFFGNVGVNASKKGAFYAGVKDSLWNGNPNLGIAPVYGGAKKFFHRLSYTAQLIIARKFSPGISIELLPTYVHRNFVRDSKDENYIFALGVAGRFKVSKRVAILADYFYVFSAYRMNNSSVPFHMPISIGVEIETGGHVFHIDISNARGIETNNFLVESPDSWQYAEIKLGFNISRVFNVGQRLKKAKEKVEG